MNLSPFRALARHSAPDMEHPVANDQYRDVYNERDRKRGHRKGPTSKIPRFIAIAIISAALYILGLLVLSMCWELIGATPLNVIFFGMSNPQGILNAAGNLALGDCSLMSPVFYMMEASLDCWAGFLVMRSWAVQNIPNDPSRINDHEGDAHIEQPEVLMEKYNCFPDAGAHSGVNVTAALSHMMFTNGSGLHHLPTVKIAKRYPTTTADHKKGDLIYRDDGSLVVERKPMIDKKFGDALWDSSFIPKKRRKRYNPFDLLYNPKNVYGKQKQDTVGDHIRQDWHFPIYERQRPAGAYVTDDKPNNTIIIGKTRSAKGQTVINNTLDMWSRQDEKPNVVANDPKGELYLAFYHPYTVRGYNVMAFNLINERKTSIFNPLGYAWDSAVHGDYQNVEQVIDNLGSIFFPVGKDKFWSQASQLVFKRSALELIDYYLDQLSIMRERARKDPNVSQDMVLQAADKIGGHVTLYNTYQMMKLSQYKSTNPRLIHLRPEDQRTQKQDYLSLFSEAEGMLPIDSIRSLISNVNGALKAMMSSPKTMGSVYGIALTSMSFFADQKVSKLTSGRPSQNFDMASLGFPRRIQIRLDRKYMRDKSLNDARVHWDVFSKPDFAKKHEYQGSDFKHDSEVDTNGWISCVLKGIFPKDSAYLKLTLTDPTSHLLLRTYYFKFSKTYKTSANGETFVYNPITHERVIQNGVLRELKRNKKGKFVPGHTTYNSKESLLVKGENARLYIHNEKVEKELNDLEQHDIDPNTGRKVAGDDAKVRQKNMQELTNTLQSELKNAYANDNPDNSFLNGKEMPDVKMHKVRAFTQTSIHYTEKPKAIFCVTPPNLQKYSRIILIMLDQMFNMQVSMAYMTKSNQKPLYITNYMLDEVGNLRSGGKGIPGLTTKESIGLGQGQRYTLVVQDLQQFKDIYGQNSNKTIEGNTGNFIYLKSTDYQMLQELSNLSGTTHHTYRDSRSLDYNNRHVVNRVSSKIHDTMAVKKVNVLSVNYLMNMPRFSQAVLGKGNPIVSQNQDVMPMAYRLFRRQNEPYTLSTIPSLADTAGFDILANQPDIYAMVNRRVRQAKMSKAVEYRYMRVHHLSKDQFNNLDANARARVIMKNVNAQLDYDDKKYKAHKDANKGENSKDVQGASDLVNSIFSSESKNANKDGGSNIPLNNSSDDDNVFKQEATPAEDTLSAQQMSTEVHNQYISKRYAKHSLSRQDLCFPEKGGMEANPSKPKHVQDALISEAYGDSINGFRKDKRFDVNSHGSLFLRNANGNPIPLVYSATDDNQWTQKNNAIERRAEEGDKTGKGLKHTPGPLDKDPNDDNSANRYHPTNAFYKFLVDQDSWQDIAGGQFDDCMYRDHND